MQNLKGGFTKTTQLQQSIDLAQSLSLTEQIELLKTLSTIIQRTHSLENKATTTEKNTDFSRLSFRQSWQQAMTGETLPISQLKV
ncbi:hypothetical protein [Microcoleus sp. bin38.metabat.b11b12b14.051]|uniref:hypothetical protein n=1 Tax=Microcoleus sp. bin38.metabat.b11b12b14.051 TaxID=2742709 RepID=UPI0025FAA413|nr:hypothetical protein [Microcoleus sp. bin38.metabat.b11b12b14.051]